ARASNSKRWAVATPPSSSAKRHGGFLWWLRQRHNEMNMAYDSPDDNADLSGSSWVHVGGHALAHRSRAMECCLPRQSDGIAAGVVLGVEPAGRDAVVHKTL